MLALDTDRHPTGNEEVGARTGTLQHLDAGSDGPDQLLAVVEYQQHSPISEPGDQTLERRPMRLALNANTVGDRVLGGVAHDPGKTHKVDTARELRHELLRHLGRQ